MKKTEAFQKLGYAYTATRGVWSAERPGAVLMTVWQREIGWRPGPNGGTLYCDLDELHPIGSVSRHALDQNSRLKTRVRRLSMVVEDPSILLDIVLLIGEVGNEAGEAIPWHDEEMGWKWFVARLEVATFSFCLEARRHPWS